jgi:hypothetical protein
MINIFTPNNNTIDIIATTYLRRNPTRMAQRWKLVPTLRHKQCPNTICGVYVGNGCRKCPKCKTVQPASTKRKRTSSPATPRKKKAEIPDGDKYKRYPLGAKVKVYWDAKKRWTWGSVVHRRAGRNHALYRVRIFGITNDAGNQLKWYLNSVCATHLKLRNTSDLLAEPNQPTRDDIVYENIHNVVGEADINISSLAEMPSCDCTSCWNKFHNANVSYRPRNVPPPVQKMADNLSRLRKGSLLYTDRVGSWDTMCEVIECMSCVNPLYSYINVKEADPDGKKTTYALKGNSNYYTSKWYFQDGTSKQYLNEDNAAIEEFSNNLRVKAEAALDTEFTATYLRRMNNFDYKLHMRCTAKKLPNGDIVFNFNGCYQENVETKVMRDMCVVPLVKPKIKELSSYKKTISSIVGTQHDWTWLDSIEARKEFKTKHPAKFKLLGCTKFNNPWNELSLRKIFYDRYDVEYEERQCFHGTFMSNLFPILHPMGGFAMANESNGKCYGQGVYFANSPYWVSDNGYCPSGVDKLRCVIVAQVLCGKKMTGGTDSWHRNAYVGGATSELRRTDGIDETNKWNANKFELTGGNGTRSIHVVWYDRCKTDVNITHVLWYR